MGVSGCGKSRLGEQLAAALGVPFHEGDDYHSAANVATMRAGIPLTDSDRVAWLDRLAGLLRAAAASGQGLVLSCSSLKRSYRDRLRAADPALRFVHLHGERTLLAQRMAARAGHFMPLSLLDSQLAVLEPLQPGEAGLLLDIGLSPDEQLAAVLSAAPAPAAGSAPPAAR